MINTNNMHNENCTYAKEVCNNSFIAGAPAEA